MKRNVQRRVIVWIILAAILINVPFISVSASEVDLKVGNNNQEKIYYEGVLFNVEAFDDYLLLTSNHNGVNFEMKYYDNDTAEVTTKHKSSIEEYQLNVDTYNENVTIEVFQEDILIDSIDENCDSYEGQASVVLTMTGATLAKWLLTAGVSIVVTKSVVDEIRTFKVTRGKSRAPSTGTPGSTYEQVDSKGNLMCRTRYGKNKKPEWRQDYTHKHYVKSLKKYLQPHQHNFTYNFRGQSTGETVTSVNKY